MKDLRKVKALIPAQAEQGTSLWKDSWLRLRKNRLAVFGAVVILFLGAVSLLAPSCATTVIDAGEPPISAQSVV